MTCCARLEIHFHEDDTASVRFETDAGKEREAFVENLMLSCFALRQMVNIGHNQVTYRLSGLLSDLEALVEEPQALERAAGPRLVEHDGRPGAKRFVAELDLLEEGCGFRIAAKGFGLFGRGLGYYAPTSVVTLVRAWFRKRGREAERLRQFAAVAHTCADAFGSGAVSPGNQTRVALGIARDATPAAPRAAA